MSPIGWGLWRDIIGIDTRCVGFADDSKCLCLVGDEEINKSLESRGILLGSGLVFGASLHRQVREPNIQNDLNL